MLPALTYWNWTKSLCDGLPRLWHSDFLFSITKQWKASPKSSIVKSPQPNNQTGSTFPLPMKRIPPFRLVGKRFYDPNAPPCKAVFWLLLILHGGFYYVRKIFRTVSYFLKYQGKNPEELTCQDVRNFLLAKKRKGWKPQLWIFIILPSVFSIGMSWISLGMISRFHVWFWNTSFQRYWLPLKSTVC